MDKLDDEGVERTLQKPRTVEDVCARAANYLEDVGWLQGTVGRLGREVCLVGALRIAIFGDIIKPGYPSLAGELYEETLRSLCKHLFIYGLLQTDESRLTSWNDFYSRSKDDILKVLRHVGGRDGQAG